MEAEMEEEEEGFAGVEEVMDDEQGASCPLPSPTLLKSSSLSTVFETFSFFRRVQPGMSEWLEFDKEEEEEEGFAGVEEDMDDEQGASFPLPPIVGFAIVAGLKSSALPWSGTARVAAPRSRRVTGRTVSLGGRGVTEE